MVGIKLNVHPLFYLFGLFYALTGKIFIFFIYTLSAVIHEIGHSLVASSLGYRLNKITLMPFGAVVSGNINGLKAIDEIKIALAGPLINLAIGIFFVASWWIFPKIYAFTDVVAEANFSLALVNFLPIFPLDGGRILSAGLVYIFGEAKARNVSKIIGLSFSILLFIGFIYSIFFSVNFSLLFFSLFVIFGALNKDKENRYIKINSLLSIENLKRGLPYKKQALYKTVTVKKMISVLDVRAINEIVVFDNDKPIKTLSQKEIDNIIENSNLYSSIENYI